MKMDIGDQIVLTKTAESGFDLKYLFKYGSLKEGYDNIDTLWRLLGELLKGEKI